jgi:hypothetical protein
MLWINNQCDGKAVFHLQSNEIGLALVGKAAWSEMSSDRGGKLYFNGEHSLVVTDKHLCQ